ncbi:tryptophan transporter [Anaerococcus lactolyticus]|uniref:Tryptophan transporter n=1 Tax=Anaerococcus lactolyticus S7-1-13 TaxID=1284686 RepID=A0A095YDU8_9FIRM|nr:tryptophan transporter [Anaerococcus lactolyticus]KGF04752.1 tryptophan transporter [Anaerococcus lactolyticus S7-1-13]
MQTNKVQTRNLTVSAIFMALGLVLHLMVPGVFFGVKPDFLLSMMFISLMIVGDAKEAVLIGVAGGIMSALTTGFPGGQIPNFIEKIITSLVVFYIIKAMDKNFTIPKIILIFALGTMVSGTLFLSIALTMTRQLNLFIPSYPAVLVAMAINAILGIFLYQATRRMSLLR